MKNSIVTFFLFVSVSIMNAQYNTIPIPEALYGTNFDLNIHESVKQIKATGNQTVTGAINNETFWGPTLIINKGDEVHMNVTNNLNESTTLHWHGMHLPAVMDGGPHQVIPAGTLWQPYWTVTNNAATYWYHPHLHGLTNSHITKGIGGFIIVKHAQEAALPLPRTYGVDDFPIMITDRRFTTANQFTVTNYTDYLMVNGVLSPQLNVPAQVVRFRLLNTSPQHSYNLGFSDNRSFSVIASDGGLLNTPSALTRYVLSPGERIEVLVNFNGQQTQTVDLKAYNSSLPSDITGATHTGGGPTDLLLGQNFNVLHFTIGAALSGALTAIPTSLITNTPFSQTNSNATRTITMIDGFLNGFPNTSFGGTQFSLTNINYTVPVNDIEIWQIVNNSTVAHTFHIHDVQFNVFSRTGSTWTLKPYDMGWKDNILVRAGETLKFVTKFEDYSDVTHPFMYHCHLNVHEDEGMMGQFVVTGSLGTASVSGSTKFKLYPNPANDKLFVSLNDLATEIYYITITTIEGRTVMMLPQPEWKNGIDVSSLASGTYLFQMMDKKTKSVTTKKFIKN